jgi:hypothetical protein
MLTDGVAASLVEGSHVRHRRSPPMSKRNKSNSSVRTYSRVNHCSQAPRKPPCCFSPGLQYIQHGLLARLTLNRLALALVLASLVEVRVTISGLDSCDPKSRLMPCVCQLTLTPSSPSHTPISLPLRHLHLHQIQLHCQQRPRHHSMVHPSDPHQTQPHCLQYRHLSGLMDAI